MQQAAVFSPLRETKFQYSLLLALSIITVTSPGVDTRKEYNCVELHLRKKASIFWEINLILKWFIVHPSLQTDTSCTSVVLGEI